VQLYHFKKPKRWITTLVVILVLILLVGIIWLNFENPIKIEKIRQDFSSMIMYENEHPVLFTLMLAGGYILSILFVIPDSTLICLLSGTIYPIPFAVVFISLCETIGALGYFLVIRFALNIYDKKKGEDSKQTSLPRVTRKIEYFIYWACVFPIYFHFG